MTEQPAARLTEGLIDLHRAYAATFRVIITEERFKLVESGRLTEYTYDSEALREPLIEHIGHLPIIAAYLHPHIQHQHEVDLGRVLTMLAIHDIGETVLGDIFTYTKVQSDADAEAQVVKKLLPDYLYTYFLEMEERQTMDAKFAKSVDSLAPILHDMTAPVAVLHQRFAHLGFDVNAIVAKKEAHFAWDDVLKEMFSYLVKKYRHLEQQN